MAQKTLKSGLSEKERQKRLKSDLIFNCSVIAILCTYFGAVLGGCANKIGTGTIWEVFEYFNAHLTESLIFFIPCDIVYVLIGLLAGVVIDVFLFDNYLRKKDIVANPHGDAAFEDNYEQYGKEFIIDPNIVEKKMGRELSEKEYFFNDDDGHKKVVIKKVNKDTYAACWKNTQIYSQNVALSINGKWCQRNSNALIFGASGAGKSRFFLSPNLLQANCSYVITDPSGDIMQGFGAFLRKEGYIIKCLNVEYMNQSCRFNPLYYIKDIQDIPVVVNSFMESTKVPGKGGGDEFWDQSAKSLLCAIIGYLFEVEPLEKRNFYNVLNLLRLAPQDENADETVDTEFDEMFQLLGRKNPGSYAYAQYKTFKLAPTKTALSTLISTAVKFSTYVDVPKFNNLTYRDEMELEKMGVAPYLDKNGKPMEKTIMDQYGKPMQQPVTDMNGKPVMKDGKQLTEDRKVPYTLEEIMADEKLKAQLKLDKYGKPVEGEPYKMALFLCIPQGDTTYNWIVGMMYSILFDKVYKAGSTRMHDLNISNPELAIPVRFLIDECANIGKIANLSEKLATCRKYRLSIVPIFQNYSQIVKVYGKEDANSIVSNCDTTLFLGGADPETLKIITAHMGKETVRTMSSSHSKASKGGGSLGQNFQQTGRELMSSYQIEQMKNSDCLVFIRAVRPFLDKKYPLQNHPNYKFTAEKNRKEYSFTNPFVLNYDDEEIESIRMKSISEEGFIEPQEVASARGRAAKAKRHDERLKKLDEYQEQMKKLPTFSKIKQENVKMDIVMAVRALDKDAADDKDEECILLLHEFDLQHGLNIYEEKIPDAIAKNDGDKEPQKTPEEHKRDVEKHTRASNIIKAQNGYSAPSAERDDYSLVASFNPLEEFSASIITDEDRKHFSKFFQDTKPAGKIGVAPFDDRRQHEAKEKSNKDAADKAAREEAMMKADAEKLAKMEEERQAKLAEQQRLEEEKKAEEERIRKEQEAEMARLEAEKREAEAKRIAAEKAAEEARIKAEQEAKAKAEQEERERQEALRLQKEKEEADRIRKEQEEAERKAREEEARREAERLEAERKAEEERLAKIEADKKAAEEAARLEAENKARAEAEANANVVDDKEAKRATLMEQLAKAKRKAERTAILAQLAALDDEDDEEEVETTENASQAPVSKPETTVVEEVVTTEPVIVNPVVEDTTNVEPDTLEDVDITVVVEGGNGSDEDFDELANLNDLLADAYKEVSEMEIEDVLPFPNKYNEHITEAPVVETIEVVETQEEQVVPTVVVVTDDANKVVEVEKKEEETKKELEEEEDEHYLSLDFDGFVENDYNDDDQ